MSTALDSPPRPSTEAGPPETVGLRRAVVGSAVWLSLGFAAVQAIRLASTVVLPGLLYPKVFGLVALASTILIGLHMFADLGIRTAVVQSSRGDDPRFLATAWTLGVIRGFALWGVSCALAWPAAYGRAEPEPLLVWLLPVLGLTTVIEGLASTSLYTLNRQLNQRRLVLIEVGSAAVSTGVTIFGAWLSPSPWALVGGAITGAVLRTAFSYWALPAGHNYLCWDRAAARELGRIGRWIYVSTACTFLGGYVDKLVVGFWSITTLGVYYLAGQLVQVPLGLMQTLAAQLVFPLYSRLIRAGRAPAEVFASIHLASGMAGALLIAGLLATGPTAVLCLWDTRYHQAGWMLRWLAVGAWFQILEANAGSVLFARGHAHISAASNAAKAGTLFALVPTGFAWGGLSGLILGFVVGDVVRYLVTARAVRRRGLPLLRHDLPLTGFVFALGFGAERFVELLWPGGSLPDGRRDWALLLSRLGAGAILVVVAWSGTVAVLLSRGPLGCGWRRGLRRDGACA
jgi:O-antigen/teichoic acid export membrane protein